MTRNLIYRGGPGSRGLGAPPGANPGHEKGATSADRTKLWIGLGAIVLAGTGGPLRAADLMASASRLSLDPARTTAGAVAPAVRLVQAAADQGGEAGEGG